jgi:hypothetical protein
MQLPVNGSQLGALPRPVGVQDMRRIGAAVPATRRLRLDILGLMGRVQPLVRRWSAVSDEDDYFAKLGRR